MACAGCQERRNQAHRLYEAARKRDAVKARDAVRKFSSSAVRDVGRLARLAQSKLTRR